MTRVKRTVFVCDCCKSEWNGGDETDVLGYHGKVTEVRSGGGVSGIEWYACSDDCIQPAILNVTKEAWEK
jgi:hypothetical protein